MERRKYDSTVARIAGNIASGMMPRVMPASAGDKKLITEIAATCVACARAIVEEVERTTPPPDPS